MSGILKKLIDLGVTLGTITEVHMYDSNFINIEGVTHEGSKFSLSLHLKEETEND